ncbi:rod shape-determining protein MreC [Roseateles terrae]|uniref:Cell shape-determining protein MreC n=1 Tax=Roseateles terrae TaxID=431060 RepID=A0ABR6GVK9_9BURK|nr:rod shape-determining protein MreC [Roseateles terrae]MBB3196151.1 rod shape-determining protein MreC [Roseateles terrae]OWQ85387.1 rod shape-determining protein MreC [Roseateles terrae]
MPLGTLDRNPPPLFREGPSALTKLAFCAALAVFLMVADARFNVTAPARAGLALALHPMQRVLLVPVDAWEQAGDYSRGMERATEAENQARRQLAEQAVILSRANQLQSENQRLRSLLGLREALPVTGLAAEVLYEAPDPFSRRIVIDRGGHRGVRLGAPVVNDAGVLGQVTRVYPLSAEVTLLTDREATIPVLNARTQQRGVAYGGERGVMELRFMAANADIKAGDDLVTSGLDGVYPPGLPVAKVSEVERRGDTSFARVGLAPVAQPDSARHVLVLEPLVGQEEARAEAEAEAASAAAAAESGGKGKGKSPRASRAAAPASEAAPAASSPAATSATAGTAATTPTATQAAPSPAATRSSAAPQHGTRAASAAHKGASR